jgi:uncharacterized protein YkwD
MEIDPRTLEVQIHDAVNNVRTIRDLSPLKANPKLCEIARNHSQDMAQRGYVGHSTPTGTDMRDRYDRFDYDCRTPIEGNFQYATGGENIARLYIGNPTKRSDGRVVIYENASDLAHGAVWGWMHSQGHKENLLKPYWRREGIGIEIQHNEVYITQNFC